jgi:hypothetical protein
VIFFEIFSFNLLDNSYPEDLVQHEYGLFDQAYRYFRDQNFNKDLFSFKSKPQNQITEYSKVLKSFQKGLFLIKVLKE